MEKKIVISLFLIFGLILISGFISAGFEAGNLSHLIDKKYGPSDYIKGWINISLNDEPSNFIFKDSFQNSISLIDLININQDFQYSCSTSNCTPDYSATDGETTKTFDLDNRESKIIGFKFTGNIVSINSIKFTVESDAASLCYNQIEIDILNDKTIDKGNNKTLESSTACSFLRNYGCFNSSKSMTIGTIGTTPYCQRIQLSESPGFKLGAWVKDSKNLVMALYDTCGNSIEGANCELPESTGEGEISCNINYLITETKDYYVCIYSDEGTGESKIRGYSDLEGCGFQEIPTGSNSENTAYQIFAEGIKFAAVETLEITNSLPYGNTFANDVSDYIWEKYKGLDCSTNACVVPIKFISGKDQKITISNLSINYDTVGFSGAEENKFYELIEIPATINSDFQKLYLNQGNFSVPDSFGAYTFLLNLSDKEIFSEEIVVEKVPIIKSLIPTTTASAFPTEFEVIINSDKEITKYEWDFGNEDIKITTTNKITYTYNFTGQYELKISVTDSNQKSSYKIFNVIVNSPEEIINTTLKKKLEDLTNVDAQIKEFDLFYQKRLISILYIEELERKLISIQKKYNEADSESQYNEIMKELLEIRIPKSITISKRADLVSFAPDKNKIKLEILQLVGRGNYDSNNEEKYHDAIFIWNQKNIETKINFKELTARYEHSDELVLKVFEFKIIEKEDLENNFYFILNELDGLEFKENYGKNEESGYTSINLLKTEKTIAFSITEDIDLTDLPLFISPDLNKLVIISDNTFDEIPEKTSKWTLFILIILLLVIGGFIIYIILQEWYKKKYEQHLFKSQNSLYNLITYIENAKKRGLKSENISLKLKKSGWSSEQIKYVMRKYSGKRTGMFEIPVRKILDKFKKKNPKKVNAIFPFQHQKNRKFPHKYRQ